MTGSRYDVIRNEWTHVIARTRKALAASNKKTPAFRPLSFKYLRKTGSNLIRKMAGREIAETYLAHVDRSQGKKYHNPDFVKLSKTLRKLRKRLQTMFDTAEKIVPDPKSNSG